MTEKKKVIDWRASVGVVMWMILMSASIGASLGVGVVVYRAVQSVDCGVS